MILPRMNVRFGAFDVIMEIVSQRVYQVDGIVSLIGTRVTWEENECDVSDVVTNSRVSTWNE